MYLYAESNGTSARRGSLRAGDLGVDTELRREHDQRGLGRVADHRTVVADRRVTGEHQRHRQRPEIGDRAAGGPEDGALLRVAAAFDR